MPESDVLGETKGVLESDVLGETKSLKKGNELLSLIV